MVSFYVVYWYQFRSGSKNKELERLLRAKKSVLSPEKAIAIAKTIYTITIETPFNRETIEQVLILNKDQQYLAKLFKF
jgi:hypothetical protein